MDLKRGDFDSCRRCREAGTGRCTEEREPRAEASWTRLGSLTRRRTRAGLRAVRAVGGACRSSAPGPGAAASSLERWFSGPPRNLCLLPRSRRRDLFFEPAGSAGAGGLECVFLFASDVWKGNSAARTPVWSSDPNFLNPGSREAPVAEPRGPAGRALSLPFPALRPSPRSGQGGRPSVPAPALVPVPTWAGHHPALGRIVTSLSPLRPLLF